MKTPLRKLALRGISGPKIIFSAGFLFPYQTQVQKELTGNETPMPEHSSIK
jgi:hypothetical protein